MKINKTAAVYAGTYVAGQIGGVIIGSTIAKKIIANREAKLAQSPAVQMWPHLKPTHRSMLDR